VAASYGMSEVEVGVMPALVLVRAEVNGKSRVDLGRVGGGLRLDQVGDVFGIVDLPARTGSTQLRASANSPGCGRLRRVLA